MNGLRDEAEGKTRGPTQTRVRERAFDTETGFEALPDVDILVEHLALGEVVPGCLCAYCEGRRQGARRRGPIFRHSRDGVIKIGAEALATMLRFRQRAPGHLEAGGLLLGRYLRDGHDLIVDTVTTPMPSDIRTRFTFERGAEGHQEFVTQQWEASGGTCVVLGDWHTHAEPYPHPSDVDLANWRQLLSEAEEWLGGRNAACFFVIVGQATLRGWEGFESTGEVKHVGDWAIETGGEA